MDRDALRQFARRDWSAVATSKTRHWRTLKTARPAVDVAGTIVPFISPEDLIVTKLLAGREKDIDDVRQSDLTPVLERELDRWRRSGQ